MALMGVLLLMLGWTLGDKKGEWEEQMLTEAAISRYGEDKSIRIGLELGTDLRDMNEMILGLQQAGTALIEKAETAEPDEEASESDGQEESPEAMYARCLLGLHAKVLEVHGRYCFTSEEIAAIHRLQAAREAAAEAEAEAAAAAAAEPDEPDEPAEDTADEPDEPAEDTADTPPSPIEPADTVETPDDTAATEDATVEPAVDTDTVEETEDES